MFKSPFRSKKFHRKFIGSIALERFLKIAFGIKEASTIKRRKLFLRPLISREPKHRVGTKFRGRPRQGGKRRPATHKQ